MHQILMNLANQNKIISQKKIWKAFLFAFFVVGILFLAPSASAAIKYRLIYPDKTPFISMGGTSVVYDTLARCTDGAKEVNEINAKETPPKPAISCETFDDTSIPAVVGEVLDNPGKVVVDPIVAGLEAIIKGFLFGMLQFFGWIFSMTATLFQYLLEPANISGAGGLLNHSAVKDVWFMVRDTLNMTFILILLFAAFCTVFQVDKWSLKKVWLSILINALLVNFSFPIARFFIDVSNVAMYYFLNNLFSGPGQGNGSAIMASFGDASGLSSILTPSKYENAEISFLIAAIVFTFVLGITMFVLAALFVIRLIALVMIVMFSPIGFVGFIFPETSKFASDWWSNLFKYSFFGPIMVFMIMVALRVMSAMPTNLTVAAQANAGDADAGWIAKAAFYTIPIVIMWVAMGIAQTMNIAVADKIVGAGQKFAKWAGNLPVRGVKTATKAGLERFDRKVLKTWSPRAIKAGWDANRKTVEDNHITNATGAWRDRLNKWGSWRTGFDNKTHFQDAAYQSTVLAKAKELGDVNQESEYLMSEYLNAMKKSDKKTMSAVLRLMFSNNDQNEFMKLQGEEVDPIGMKNLIFKQLTEEGKMSKAEAAKQLSDLSEIAVMKGNTANYGMANYKDGRFVVSSDIEQIAASEGKARNIKSQGKLDNWHWNSFCVENEAIEGAENIARERVRGNIVVDPKTGEDVLNKNGKVQRKVGRLHDAGRHQLNTITEADVNSATRVRADFYNILERKKEIMDHVEKLKKGNEKDQKQAILVKKFIDKIETKAAEDASGGKVAEEKKPKVEIVDRYGRPMS